MKSRMVACIAAALIAVSVPLESARAGLLYDLLFAPTYDPDYVPEVYGTPYDCRPYRASGQTAGVWRGLIGGQSRTGSGTLRQISQEACFASRQDCEAYLVMMRRYIDMVFTHECRPL
ncbi:hypothetical protein [Polymorphum gilvum]|uniref:Secreted protein n=1 Tax=Polymorphum gilvum (strain LMG 25793 / CGMCC 1.9160 / SL003B-26A1) TaxID=991905 RepID=F2IV64_POLGS|nr:hypothetical protein [Polymorphum gilvum]ADZ71395.1 hypothetical protein SL003B_2972 [Polymorphum gilvum SL003B-26A1]